MANKQNGATLLHVMDLGMGLKRAASVQQKENLSILRI
jgi:hypothetical protein